MTENEKRIKIEEEKLREINKQDFFKKGFWICFSYVLWDTFTGLGLI